MEDRLGHDRRYAVDATKAKHELSWAPSVEFAEGLAATIARYRDHQAWLGRIESGAYREWGGEPPLSPSAPEDGPKVAGRGNRQESLLEAGKTVFVVDDLSTGSGR